jgi:DNA-binding MarR family transcriptional regulator
MTDNRFPSYEEFNHHYDSERHNKYALGMWEIPGLTSAEKMCASVACGLRYEFTISFLARFTRLSKSTVYRAMRKLVQAGRFERTENRTFRLVDSP